MYVATGRELIDPFRLLERSGIRSGMSVADFGCGTLGHYVFPAARLVGKDGTVYAVDILKSVLSGIESRRKMESAHNVVTVWGDLERPNGVKIPDGTVDIGLLVNNLFLSRQQDELVRECARMVKSGGTLVVVDWKPAGATFGPEPSVRVSADAAKQLVAAAGLTVGDDVEPGPYHWGFLATKP